MKRRKFLIGLGATGAAVATLNIKAPSTSALAQSKGGYDPTKLPYLLKRKVTHADRKLAASNQAKFRKVRPGVRGVDSSINATGTNANILGTGPTPTPGGIADYFGTDPNWALSPTTIRKFVDSLPGLTPAGANTRGSFIPLGAPDTTSYPGSDYYEIGLVEYDAQFHSDLGLTKLRGYKQLNTVDKNNAPLKDPFGNAVTTTPHYLGPIIVAQRDRPVRVKFTNLLPSTANGGNLFIPVDTTVMGAGTGINGAKYTENRAILHLHGGNTPWISDGTAHQWTAPVSENSTTLLKGVSAQDVPDMPATGAGELTFYWTNQQSARLMFYHDHAYGLTRLNVYAGEAAGYIVQDPDEQSLVTNGSIPPLTDTIPLIIQDKTFIDSDSTSYNYVLTLDPTWPFAVDSTRNDLWFPHVYMPNQNPYDLSGANAMGRWDYGPWFWPPNLTIAHLPTQTNPYQDLNNPGSPPIIPATPNASIVPEGFMDTPLVNGQAYPYLEVEPKAYRFMVLNACNDRFLNLQLYKAKSQAVMWNTNSNGVATTLNDGDVGEVNMVPAAPGVWPAGWPTADGRDGGFPDPLAVGPNFIQIGTEGGLLPAPVTIPNRPVGYDYNRRNIVVLNVLEKALFMGPAERADTIVDFTNYAGQTIILYNDAPAPVPAFDPRNDYYTGAPDHSLTGDGTGGAYTTMPGYGPNTRTIMQIRVKGTVATSNNYVSGKIATTLPAVFAKSQDRVIVLNNNYNSTYGVNNLPTDSYVRIQDKTTSKGVYNNIVSGIALTNAGSGYVNPPTVTISGGYGVGATAVANMVTTGIVQSFNLLSGGAGYTQPPTVLLVAPAVGGVQATASSTLAGTSIKSIAIVNGGTGYSSAPTVNITGGGGSGATATAVLKAGGTVSSITITNRGANYTSAPTVTLSAPPAGGTRATATATMTRLVSALTLTGAGTGYSSAPTVTISGGGGSGATATATITGYISNITVGNGGSGYRNAPNVAISGGGGTGAAATATINRTTGKVTLITITNAGTGYTSVPTVTLSGGSGTNATGTATISTKVASLTITANGSGYTGTPTVSFSGGGGTGAAATATVSSSIASVTVVNAGSGYTTAPTVSFSGGGGTGAAATASLTGSIASITVTNAGSGYTSLPTVGFSGGGGSGATTTVVLNPTSVAAITIVNGGSGYATAPAVSITPTDGKGGGAAATSVLAHNGIVKDVTVTNGGGGYISVPTVTFSAPPSGITTVGTAAILKSNLTLKLEPKCIQELFEMEYGRMNAILGSEVPNTTGVNQTTLPNSFIDPPNEIVKDSDPTQPIGSAADGTQIWKITHNGVDTHAIHFHLFNVQVLNRVGWDGAVRLPDANELGWKDTVRMNPLEDCIVALRPFKQNLPTTGAWAGGLPNSVRSMDVTQPTTSTMGFTGIDPTNMPAPVTNQKINFGWEYTWHCHLLGHEENDMMRPIIFGVAPVAPTGVAATAQVGKVVVGWTNAARSATQFTVQRATTWNGPWTTLGSPVPVTVATTYSYTDTTVVSGTTYFYRVIASNVVGYTQTYAAPSVGYANTSIDSTPANALPVSAL